MATQTLGLPPEFLEYYRSIACRESSILAELRRETGANPMAMMQIAPEQGQFMAFLVKLIGAKKTLEVGVFTGYSSLAVALALPEDGRVIACDVSEEYTTIARRYWEKAGVSGKIDLRVAPAVETLDNLLATGHGETFDFAFIDADKSNYDRYYEQSLELVRSGGVIAIDNVFWGGKVADAGTTDNRTKIIRSLNEKIHADKRVDISVVPIGDGLTLARKL
ncbi:class I SAM-dependent methyltransferase [Pannus brasiliensis CCIBt3594]|uniref:Class I SAM-dependent methyltransferase n=1 Tax=Pannus brasiliensis CCIBt3594 TaxID=1427578 RepID=A0AAW9QPR0_9CHRO